MEKWRNIAIKLNSNIFRGNVAIRGKLLHDGPDTIGELLERHVVNEEKNYNSDEDEFSVRWCLTSTQGEALSLYRDIIRATRFFAWPNDQGVLWCDILREDAPREFQDARFDKLAEKQKRQMAQEPANFDCRGNHC